MNILEMMNRQDFKRFNTAKTSLCVFLRGLMFFAFKIDEVFSAEKGDAEAAQRQVGQTGWANQYFPAC
jgi:hypothetical protein